MSTIPAPLKYLWTAVYGDGSRFHQTQADESVYQAGKSAFADIDHERLTLFVLQRESDDKRFEVDLINGLFEIDGNVIDLSPQNFVPTEKLQLVFFREIKVDQEIRATVQADMTVLEEPIGEPKQYVNRYFFGWETTLPDGSKLERTIGIF